MAGLLDFLSSPEAASGLGLLAAAGPRFDGAGFGQRLQEGIQYGQNRQDAEEKRKAQRAALEMQALQMQEVKQKIAEQQQLRELAQRFQIPAQQGLAPLQGDPQSGILPSVGRAAAPAGFNYQGYAGAMAGVDPMKALALQQLLQKESQINKLDVKDFTPASVAKFAQSKNYGDLVRMDKVTIHNTGGQTMALDPFTGKPLNAIANTQSPDNAASTSVTMRGQDMTNKLGWANNNLANQRFGFDQSQAAKPQFKDGSWVTPPTGNNPTGSITETPYTVAPKGSQKGNEVASTKAIGLIDQADKLLNTATGSYAGTGVDMAAGLFGASTAGAKSSQKLKALEGSLMMAQPRMEGPQSDRDVQLYRQMAGQVGDSTIPTETRRAALQIIRQLHEKYAPNVGGSSGSWGIQRIN